MIWTDDEELLFKRHSEICECMGILHQLSYVKYNRLSVVTNVPVIVIASISGFLSTLELFVQQQILIGVLSIFIGLIKSLDSYFNFTTRGEAHRITSLSYIKKRR